MTIHAYHEDTHTHGLADDCPRCAEHAEYPLEGLDRENIQRLIRGDIHTRTDAAAAARLTTTLERGRHLQRVLDGEMG